LGTLHLKAPSGCAVIFCNAAQLFLSFITIQIGLNGKWLPFVDYLKRFLILAACKLIFMIDEEIALAVSEIDFNFDLALNLDGVINPNYAHFSSAQSIYVCNLQSGDIVYQNNLKDIFGMEVEFDTYAELNERIHPDDRKKVVHIVKYTLLFLKDKGINQASKLKLSYRVKDAEGNYVQLMRTSYMMSPRKDEALSSNLSIIDSMGFMSITRPVQFAWIENGKQSMQHKEYVLNQWVSPFSKREMELLEFVGQGLRYREIADRLCIDDSTVKKHISNMRDKCGAANKIGLLAVAKLYAF
jgi:DNA-binding CsgD family transcriptional regulator